MADRFHTFDCFFAKKSGGFFRFDCSVGAAAENHRDVLVFDACRVKFRQHGQKHHFTWCVPRGVVHDYGDFAFWLGDFA